VPGGRPAKAALVCGDRTLSFAELGERAARVAAVIGRLGLAPRDRVAAMLTNSAAFFEVGLGAAMAHCPVVPVNWHLKHEELTWVVQDSEARLLIADAALAPTARACIDALPGCALLLVGDDGDDGYERALAGVTPAAGSWSAPTYFYFTSGTTGRPRAVERDAGPAEHAMFAGLAAMWGIGGDDIYLACSPLYHAANGYAYATLFQGGTVVVMERWDAREWLRLVERYRVTAFFMVPAYFIRLLEVPPDERAAYDTSSLRLVLHAAAPCPVPVKWQILDALPSAEIWEFYGATEGGATRISPDAWRAHPGSVGMPWPGVEILILDAEGRPVGPGETGRIYIRPPGGARFRYHNDAGKTDAAWVGDAFSVGDVGHLDGDGYLYVTDRASDMVLRGGVNIYPAEVEAVLQQHPAVVDCAVLGVPDPRLGEELLALVEVRRPVGIDELRVFCRQHLADFKVPREIEIVETLPRDPTGKVLKRRVRDERRAARTNASEGR